ncbi:MAG: hypothetical protein WAX77_08605 [Methylococcaceae bacterium]
MKTIFISSQIKKMLENNIPTNINKSRGLAEDRKLPEPRKIPPMPSVQPPKAKN